MRTSANSVSFVITAIYTYTFANAVSRVLQFNEKTINIEVREDATLVTFLCVFICHTMALRFFFGNNNYVDELYTELLSAGERFYHLFVIVLQSLILLGSSYLIRNPAVFFVWIATLFIVEVLWYAGCALFLRHAIKHKDGNLNRPLARNEFANFGMALGAVIAAVLWKAHLVEAASFLAGLAFGINTVIDLMVNFKNYMGVSAVSLGREELPSLPLPSGTAQNSTPSEGDSISARSGNA